VNKLTIDKVEASKINTVKSSENRCRALSLLIEEMSVCYPAPYYDIKAIVAEEIKGFKSNGHSKVYLSELYSKRSKNKKTLDAFSSLSL
jgi:hypothetical protein